MWRRKLFLDQLSNPDYDIRGVAYSWFESYLKDRKQYV